MRTAFATRRSTFRTAGALLAGGALAPAAAACGAPGETQAPAAQSGPIVELRAHGQGTSDGEGYNKNVEAFNRQFAGKYRAEHIQNTGDNYVAQDTAFAAGTSADLYYAHTSNMRHQSYAIKGVAKQLDPFAAKDKNFNINSWTQRAQDVMKIVDGKLYGLPVRGQVSWLFLYWNKEMLSKAGIPEPNANWTLDELITHAKKLQQPGNNDFFPIAYGGASGFERVAAEVRRWGGEFFEVPGGAGKRCMLDSGPCVQAIRWFHDNTKAGIFAPRLWSAAEFGQGKSAFLFGHLAGQRATVANNAKGAFEWTFNIVPKGVGGKRGGFLSIDMQQMWVNTKSPDGAWELMKWLTSVQSGVNIALQPVGSLTPGYRKEVYCSPELINDPRFPKSAMQANCDNWEQPDTYIYPHNLRLQGDGHIQPILDKYMNAFLDLQMEPTPATVKEMTSEIQKVLDMPRL
jgi:ABC-type glycerol-3-phosphate transport system substrate-binding protein